MNTQEILLEARKNLEGKCMACPICNGKACGNRIPGPGAKGSGDTAIRNYNKWQEIRLNMDTITEQKEVDISMNLWGRKFGLPVFAGPVGAVSSHYGEKYNEYEYNEIMLSSCAKEGIFAFTGDGLDPDIMKKNTGIIQANSGMGIPTMKPWDLGTIGEKIKLVHESDAFAVAMDIDAAGLPFLKQINSSAGCKSVNELKEIVQMTDKPFILKGIMTVKGALKAKETGAAAIVVSNHGGRVLDQCAATAEVLEAIVKAVDGSMKVFVDGGIRSGIDIFKALALGADGVLICRPFVPMVFGGGAEGVNVYISRLREELKDVMQMCGAYSLKEITRDMVITSGF